MKNVSGVTARNKGNVYVVIPTSNPSIILMQGFDLKCTHHYQAHMQTSEMGDANLMYMYFPEVRQILIPDFG